MNARERELRPSSSESAERAAKGPYSVATIRAMAGVPHTEMGKPAGELNIDHHKKRLREMTIKDLDHSHIAAVSTQERLNDPEARIDIQENVSKEERDRIVKERNEKWVGNVWDWLQTTKDSASRVTDAVTYMYGIDLTDDEKGKKNIEQLRHAVFDRKDPQTQQEIVAGEANIEKIVHHFVHKFDQATHEVIAPLSEADVKKYLQDIEPFLYIFGGADTVARLKVQILAASGLVNAPAPTDREAREKWAAQIESRLNDPIEEDIAPHFGSTLSGERVIGVGSTSVPEEVPVDPAAVEREQATSEPSARQGSGWAEPRRGAIGASGAPGDGGTPGGGGEGGDAGAERRSADETYAAALLLGIERVMNAPGNENLKAAYETMLSELLEPEIIDVPLGDEDSVPDSPFKIKADMVPTADGKEVVGKVGNGFVKYEARRIRMSGKPWKQGILVNETKTFTLDLAGMGGPKEYNLAGLVGLVRGPDGRTLINLAQEPAAQYLPKYAVFRTPMQTSATKINAVLDGETHLDPTIADVMKRIFPGKTLRQLLASGEVHHFFPPDADGNRLVSDNLGFELVISDAVQWDELLRSGKYYAASDRDMDMLSSAKLVNGITSSSNSAARGAAILRSQAA